MFFCPAERQESLDEESDLVEPWSNDSRYSPVKCERSGRQRIIESFNDLHREYQSLDVMINV